MYLDTDKNSLLKLIDFGLSEILNPNQKIETRTGTPFYIAPEVLDG